jgi:hypothetical protein
MAPIPSLLAPVSTVNFSPGWWYNRTRAMRKDLFRGRIAASDSGAHWEIRLFLLVTSVRWQYPQILLFSFSRYTDQVNVSTCDHSMMTASVQPSTSLCPQLLLQTIQYSPDNARPFGTVGTSRCSIWYEPFVTPADYWTTPGTSRQQWSRQPGTPDRRRKWSPIGQIQSGFHILLERYKCQKP